MRRLLLLPLLALLLPLGAVATPLGDPPPGSPPPLGSVPPVPETPPGPGSVPPPPIELGFKVPVGPPADTPPIWVAVPPGRPDFERPVRPDVPVGPPDPLPGRGHAPPDLDLPPFQGLHPGHGGGNPFVTPEPQTALLFGFGLAGLAFAGRRRRA